jgi:dTDP-4-amino-4,6-dideoxygalactose transaminase
MSTPLLPIARPSLGEEEIEATARCIRSGWVTQGPEVAAFEKEFAEAVGAPHACAVSNCTTALHLALLVAGVTPGDEVITVSHSFIATANAVQYCGARPRFVDVDPATYNIDPDQLEAAITRRTRAILCVHQLGMPCDLRRIVDIGRRHGIPVIEDAACAAGSEIFWDGTWQKIGRPHGDIACFSFHPRKVITTGDGGMITTRHAGWDRDLRLLRQHGMSVPDTVRHRSAQVVFESYDMLGYNYRLTDLQAAVGRVQLRRLPGLVAERRMRAERYRQLLTQVAGVTAPVEPEWARSNWQSFAVRLAQGQDQRAVMQAMLDRGVATRRGVMCAHRQPPYAGYPALPESEAAEDNVVLLPLFPGITDADQALVIGALTVAVAMEGSEVRA